MSGIRRAVDNDGDTPVFNVRWEWLEGVHPPHVFENPFPVSDFPAGYSIRVPVILMMDTSFAGVLTRWEDAEGVEHEQSWPVSFL